MGEVERASRYNLACWCLWQLRRRELTPKRCQRFKVDISADLTEHLQGYRMVLEMSLATCLLLPDALNDASGIAAIYSFYSYVADGE
jgi:hypothetical protein